MEYELPFLSAFEGTDVALRYTTSQFRLLIIIIEFFILKSLVEVNITISGLKYIYIK